MVEYKLKCRYWFCFWIKDRRITSDNCPRTPSSYNLRLTMAFSFPIFCSPFFLRLKRNKKHPNQFHSNAFSSSSSSCLPFFVPQINQFYATENNPTKLYPNQKKNIASRDRYFLIIHFKCTDTIWHFMIQFKVREFVRDLEKLHLDKLGYDALDLCSSQSGQKWRINIQTH